MAELPEGWIAHDGGPCPVEKHVLVSVLFDDGDDEPMTETAFVFSEAWWLHCGAPGNNIIAYKPEGQHHGDADRAAGDEQRVAERRQDRGIVGEGGIMLEGEAGPYHGAAPDVEEGQHDDEHRRPVEQQEDQAGEQPEDRDGEALGAGHDRRP